MPENRACRALRRTTAQGRRPRQTGAARPRPSACPAVRRSWGALPLAACASLGGREPLTVDVVGVEPLAGQGMEGRFLVKLRLQNPGETPVDFDGVSVSLDVRGSRLASGGATCAAPPRFGETVIAVPSPSRSAPCPPGAGFRQRRPHPARLRAARPSGRPGLRRGELQVQRRADAAGRRRLLAAPAPLRCPHSPAPAR